MVRWDGYYNDRVIVWLIKNKILSRYHAACLLISTHRYKMRGWSPDEKIDDALRVWCCEWISPRRHEAQRQNIGSGGGDKGRQISPSVRQALTKWSSYDLTKWGHTTGITLRSCVFDLYKCKPLHQVTKSTLIGQQHIVTYIHSLQNKYTPSTIPYRCTDRISIVARRWNSGARIFFLLN